MLAWRLSSVPGHRMKDGLQGPGSRRPVPGLLAPGNAGTRHDAHSWPASLCWPLPLAFQSGCVEAFVASWTARGFAASTIDNDTGVLERMLAALGRPAWEVTAGDVDRVVGSMAAAGRAVSTRQNYLQVYKGFHRA